MIYSRVRCLNPITCHQAFTGQSVSSTSTLNQMSCPISHQLQAIAADKKSPISFLKSKACSCRTREWPESADVTCLAIACPSCMTLPMFIQDAGVARVCRCDMSGHCLPLLHDPGAGAQLLQLCNHHHQWSRSHPNSQRRSVPVDHQLVLWHSSDCLACLLVCDRLKHGCTSI